MNTVDGWQPSLQLWNQLHAALRSFAYHAIISYLSRDNASATEYIFDNEEKYLVPP